MCFVLCDHKSRKFLRSKTLGSDNVEGAASSIIKNSQLNKQPKLFFIQEAATKKKLLKGYHHPDLEGGNDFLMVRERSVLSQEGLIPTLLESFREYADRENILSMLARCSNAAVHAQLHYLSRPVVFANCYGKAKHNEQ